MQAGPFVNDIHGTDKPQASCVYECKRFKDTYVHPYNADPEWDRIVQYRLGIVTKRDVYAGEELTASYGPGYIWEGKEAAGSGCSHMLAVVSGNGIPRESGKEAMTTKGFVQHAGSVNVEKVRTRAQAHCTLEVLPVAKFSVPAVRNVFEDFEERKGNVSVMKLDDSGLAAACQSLMTTSASFQDHSGGRVTFQDMQKHGNQCKIRVEHGLQPMKGKKQKSMLEGDVNDLVHKFFRGTKFKETWDSVHNLIQTKWPTRMVLPVLIVTGDSSGQRTVEDYCNVIYSEGGQVVRCHYDNFHVVVFVVQGEKHFRVAKHQDITGHGANVNEAHHVSATDVEFARCFKEAQLSAGHVLLMEAGTWHEVWVLRHLCSLES